MSPEELRYSKTHEWVRVETQDGQQIATLGITAFALQNLTDLVYLDLAAGRQDAQGRRAVRAGGIGQGGQRPL